MWAATGAIQQRGNVWLVQNALPCTPCQLEGCERRLDSYSACLDELSAAQVIAAVDQALAARKAVKQQAQTRHAAGDQRANVPNDGRAVCSVAAASATKPIFSHEHAADDLHRR